MSLVGQARLRGALPGSARVRWRLDGDDLALTFDDGPHPEGTPAVLAALDRAGVRATFFVLLDRVAASPSLLADIVAGGHEVGLHADRHERLDREPVDALTARLQDGRRRLEDAIGRPVRLHRPPFGRLSLAGARATRRAGMEVVLWSHDPEDFDPSPGLAERVAAGLVPRAIVLLHDGAATFEGQGQATARAIDTALPVALASGVRAVPLSPS